MGRFTVTRFKVSVSAPLSSTTPARYVVTEDEAMDLARSWVGPNQDQISVCAYTSDVETFALRYLVWKAGEVRDTGWCRWVCGQFRGSGDPLDARESKEVSPHG